MGCVSGGILLYSESLLEKRLLFGLMAVAFVVLLFSMSRSGWLAGFVGAVVLFLFARQKRVFLLIVCLLLLVFPFVVPDAAVERFDFTFGQSIHPGMHVELFGVRLDTSSSARIQSWLHALHRIPRHLLFGYGITGFSFLDGQFVRVLAETGVLGLLAFLWLLWQTHHLILQALRADNLGRREAGMLTGFYAGFWAIIAHALTTNSFIIIRIAEPFWCLAGLAVVILSQHKEDVDAPSHATTGA
jgi:O-antigen ligase